LVLVSVLAALLALVGEEDLCTVHHLAQLGFEDGAARSTLPTLANIPFRFCSAVSGECPIRLASNMDCNLSRLPATIQAAPVWATARKSVSHSCRSPTAAAR